MRKKPIDGQSKQPLNRKFSNVGQIAQLVEQRTENPCVRSSILRLATIFVTCCFQQLQNNQTMFLRYSLPLLALTVCFLHLGDASPNKKGHSHLPQKVKLPKEIKSKKYKIIPSAPQDRDYYNNGKPDDARVELGQLLFFDKELSGNRNISCATCHHPFTGTSDGLSLPVGEGGFGLSVSRDTGNESEPIPERVPRNAPAIFNLGAREFEVMFHDGRLRVDPSQPSGFASPAGEDLPYGLDNVLAAQAMFPVTSGTEMAGQAGENEIADLAATNDFPGIWAALAARLQAIPEYVDLFVNAFDDIDRAQDITYVHAANAIAAFEAEVWRFDNSPFDRFLRGDHDALNKNEIKGMKLFYGEANCVSCHSGSFQTDHQFYSIAMPQLGPGKGDGLAGNEDFGLERITGNIEDRCRFRTPPLRNVALTGPWGHSGAYNSLEAVIRHHLNPEAAMEQYDPEEHFIAPDRADLNEEDFAVFETHNLTGTANRWQAIKNSSDIEPVKLKDEDIYYLVEFLYSLTDPAALDLRSHVPKSVPSGLPVFD